MKYLNSNVDQSTQLNLTANEPQFFSRRYASLVFELKVKTHVFEWKAVYKFQSNQLRTFVDIRF